MNTGMCATARGFCCLAVSVTVAALAYAQSSRGTVSGTVLDSSGAVINGANLVLTSRQTGIRLTTGSNEAGVYRFDAVDLGVYDLQVTHPGFQTCLGPGITVEPIAPPPLIRSWNWGPRRRPSK